MFNPFRKTVDGVLATLNRAITDLEKVANDQLDRADEITNEIARLDEEREVVQIEAARAARVSMRLRGLVE
jgi:prefoldin subunit 5